MEAKSLTVEPRTDIGKNESRRVRRNGFIPAVLYSHGSAEAVQILRKDFFKLFKGKISESVIFDIHSSSAKGETDRMAYVKDYHADPLTGEILHVDLFKVTKDEKIHTHVPVEFVGVAKGIKLGGILEVDARMLEVECLPMNLPEKIKIDVTNMEIGDSIHVKDLKLAEGVKLLTPAESSIVSVHVPKVAAVEEKVEEVVAVEGEGEAAAKAEGEKAAKAEGEKAPKAEGDKGQKGGDKEKGQKK